MLALLPLTVLALPVQDDGSGAPEARWWVSQFTGDWRSWLPLEDFPPRVQESPHMLIYELTHTSDPYAQPTPEQKAAADRLVEVSTEAAHRNGWFRYEQAIEDGFELMPRDRAHYGHRSYITDGHVLDPDRPEFLMYYDTSSGKKLVGYMYLMSDPTSHGPQIGGPLTLWHYHMWSTPHCLYEGLYSIGLSTDGQCAEGTPSHRSPEMIHVWFVDHPAGPFGTNMALPNHVIEELGKRPY